MSRPEDSTDFSEFSTGYWEERYRGGEGAGPHDPSPSLVVETSALAPGRALDAGCGTGRDAVWLASRGWDVTAVDVSETALTRARETARAAGRDVADRIEWLCTDLTDWAPGEQRFDLVTSHYVHVPGPVEDLVRRLASRVAPGGTLLVVGHDGEPGAGPAGPGHVGHVGHRGHAHPPGSQVRSGQVTSALPENEWEIVVAEPRTHAVQRPDGTGTVRLHDTVVRARRTG